MVGQKRWCHLHTIRRRYEQQRPEGGIATLSLLQEYTLSGCTRLEMIDDVREIVQDLLCFDDQQRPQDKTNDGCSTQRGEQTERRMGPSWTSLRTKASL